VEIGSRFKIKRDTTAAGDLAALWKTDCVVWKPNTGGGKMKGR
jgi:hypothetical protein